MNPLWVVTSTLNTERETMSLVPSSLIMNASTSFTQTMIKRQNKRYKTEMKWIDDLFIQLCEREYEHHVNQIGVSVLRDIFTHDKLVKIIQSLAQYGVTVSHIHYRFRLIVTDDDINLVIKQTVYVGGNASHWCTENISINLVNTTTDLYKPKYVKTNHN